MMTVDFTSVRLSCVTGYIASFQLIPPFWTFEQICVDVRVNDEEDIAKWNMNILTFFVALMLIVSRRNKNSNLNASFPHFWHDAAISARRKCQRTYYSLSSLIIFAASETWNARKRNVDITSNEYSTFSNRKKKTPKHKRKDTKFGSEWCARTGIAQCHTIHNTITFFYQF